MKPIFDAWLIQIEITNVCHLSCSHCTRGVPHVPAPAFAKLDFVRQALDSLTGWRKGVGCTGGEPTLHPRFAEICELYRSRFPKHQCGLWTSGGPGYERHRALIERTFGIINYNDHKSPTYHHPILLAAEECVPDAALREELIDNCWVQLHWSPIITPRGAFFCEVAATIDLLRNGPGGYPLAPGWWDKDVAGFSDQRARYCSQCSMALPLEQLPDDISHDAVSPGNAARIAAAYPAKASLRRFQVVNTAYTRKDIDRLRSAQTRASKEYARRDAVHFWSRTPLRAWFWKKAKYRHLPGGHFAFLADTARFLGHKFRSSLPFWGRHVR